MQERIVACWPGLETAFFKDETADSARKSLAGRANEAMPPAWRNDRRETPNRAPGAASVESDCIPIVSLPGPRPKNDASAMMHILSAGNPCVKSGCKSGGISGDPQQNFRIAGTLDGAWFVEKSTGRLYL
jgi:hypothetical protein